METWSNCHSCCIDNPGNCFSSNWFGKTSPIVLHESKHHIVSNPHQFTMASPFPTAAVTKGDGQKRRWKAEIFDAALAWHERGRWCQPVDGAVLAMWGDHVRHTIFRLKSLEYIYVHIYIYMCVCVYKCVYKQSYRIICMYSVLVHFLIQCSLMFCFASSFSNPKMGHCLKERQNHLKVMHIALKAPLRTGQDQHTICRNGLLNYQPSCSWQPFLNVLENDILVYFAFSIFTVRTT